MADDANADEVLHVLPLDAWHRARGARMVPFAGYCMPLQYQGIVAEHEWTRHRAGLFDVSHMGQIAVAGERPAAALEALLPADLATIEPYQQRYSLLLADDGGILDDLMITRLPDEPGGEAGFLLVVNGATKWSDLAHLRQRLAPDVTLTHREDRALLALQGPEAAAALTRLVPGAGTLSFMTAAAFDWSERNVSLWISRSGYTGEDGFEISLDARHAAALADALLAQPEVMPVGLGARDSLRLEAGLPLYGHDIDRSIDPVTAGLNWAIARRRRQEGGFPGSGRIGAALAQGTARRRVGLSLDGRLPAREGAPVFAGETEVGRVTSGGFSPTLGHPIAMGYVAAENAAHGTKLAIEVRGRQLDATVVPLPFVPHRYHRQGARR